SFRDAYPARDRGAAACDLAGVLKHLPQQPHPVARAAAVLVAAVVEARGEEILDAAKRVRGIHVDEVITGLHRAGHGVAMPAAQVGDVLLGHHPRLDRVVAIGRYRQVMRSERDFPAVEVRRVQAVVTQLDPGERAALVDRFGDAGEGRQVAVIPDPQLDEGSDVRRRVDLDLLGAYHRPAALCLDLAHRGLGAGVTVTHAVAMRDLEEPVPGDERPDGDGLKEDIVWRGRGGWGRGHRRSLMLTHSAPLSLRLRANYAEGQGDVQGSAPFVRSGCKKGLQEQV